MNDVRWSGVDQTRMKLNGDWAEHWHESWRDLSTHLPWQPVVLAAAMTTQRVGLCSTPWPRHRPPSRRRIASDWHSTHTSAPGRRRLGQSAVTAAALTCLLLWTLPRTDALEQERRTSVSSNCMQYLRTHANRHTSLLTDQSLSLDSIALGSVTAAYATKLVPVCLLLYTQKQISAIS